jgi:hypothetical protein
MFWRDARRVSEGLAALNQHHLVAIGVFYEGDDGGVADTFEQFLLKSPLVKQLFDPILMNDNSQDKQEMVQNRMQTSNEITHNNYLHATARDNYLLL